MSDEIPRRPPDPQPPSSYDDPGDARPLATPSALDGWHLGTQDDRPNSQHAIPIPGATGLWRVTTEHDTRILIDFNHQRWVRLPGPSRPIGYLDGLWQHLGWGPYLATWESGSLTPVDPVGRGYGVRVGFPFALGRGMTARWYAETVTRVERLGADLSSLSPGERDLVEGSDGSRRH